MSDLIHDRHPDRFRTLREWAGDVSDPIMERVQELGRQIDACRRVKVARAIRVNPYITVMALGRLCETHNAEARVWWEDGNMRVLVTPRDVPAAIEKPLPAFLKPQAG